ncbi:trk system potassium uptake protein TrkA [Methanomicrobium sp. W14]|uniref:potassium channel family protein n=1 Tax=Methanomicrobium sp. W14 TaxID=2817839 RepID=UPI001AE5D270|nr:TrkA family potassium uptake protein [Methanomicrobium sp. W14]MBP2132747.1 trk system potassium uptake protein TrkA [Methanomicrobium sp. W14]
MYIIIIGLGGIGRNLAAIAAEHGDSVVVIDKDESRCNEILEHYDVMAITGNSTERSILEDAGIDRADALVTTTSDDAVNLMTCWLAKRLNVKNLVSIVNQIEHSDLFKEVGVRISENPDELVATRLYYWSENPDMQQLAMIPGGAIFEITVDENAPFVDHEIKELDVKDFVFIAIKRTGKEIIIPSGTIKIKPNDKIIVFTKKDAEEECLKTLNNQLKNPKQPGNKNIF